MDAEGYAVATFDDADWTTTPGGASHAPLTAALGATETTVDAWGLDGDDAVTLSTGPERLLVPLAAETPLTVGPSTTLPPSGLARVPAGHGATVRCAGPATLLVVGAPAEPAPDEAPTVVDLDTADFVVPSTSDVATAFLTVPLGCAGMKANARRLEPGQVVPYHTEGTQEELFVPVSGPASLLVDGQTYSMGTGSVARVAPDVPRSAVNDGDEAAVWVMVGAPPTGEPTGWDPGAEILDAPDR